VISVKAYKCGWCSRCFINPGNARSHEASCEKNPERRHCITCTHGVIGVIGTVPFPERYAFDANIDIKGPVCDLHNKPISDKPYFIDCEVDEYDVGGFEGCAQSHVVQECPGTCQGYEYKGYAGWRARKRARGDHDGQASVQAG